MIKFLKRIFHQFQPPPPPFQLGQHVRCIRSSEYNHHVAGEIYTVRQLFLSTDRSFWFVRLEEIPASSAADNYVAVPEPDVTDYRAEREYF